MVFLISAIVRRTSSEICSALELGAAKIGTATAGLLSRSERSAYSEAPSSMRAMSRSRVTAPFGSVLTMMSPNSSSLCRRPCALIDSCRSILPCVGEAPHFLRQARLGLRHAVLHLLLREVGIGAELERHRERHTAVGGRLARHIEHALDAIDLLLKWRRHGLGDYFRARAGIVGSDHDGGRHHLRVLGDRQ